MKEQDFINIINTTLSDNSYLGDDCAYLKDLDIFVTHDTLIEDVHFALQFSTPYQIGYKAVMVNLSDLASNLSTPKYITVSLSLPKNTTNEFVQNLYKGINDACLKYNIKVVSGDITGSDKVVISICAIGKNDCKYSAQRNLAQVGDYIVTTGSHGASACGLKCFKNKIDNDFLKQKHLMPIPRLEQANEIKQIITQNIACMDSSDGLFDAVKQICEQSKVSAQIDFKLIPYDKEIEQFEDWKNLILFGGEDYELIFTINKKDYQKLDKTRFFKIGEIIKQQTLYVEFVNYQPSSNLIFDHFLH